MMSTMRNKASFWNKLVAQWLSLGMKDEIIFIANGYFSFFRLLFVDYMAFVGSLLFLISL